MSTFAGLSNHARERRFMIWGAVGFSGIRRSYHAPRRRGMKLEKYADLRTRLDGLGLEALAVSARADHDNPISADAGVRAEALVATKANLDSAAALGAPLICGPLGAPLAVFTGTGPTDEEKARAVTYLQELGPYADERGVTIALEYLNRFEMY